jgi:uncharacterized integral membrane protein
MWFLKNMIWIVVMVLVVGFCILNLNESITAIHLPGRVYRQIPLNVGLFAAYVIGMVTAFVLTLVQHMRIRAAMGKLTRENQDLKRELSQLRNLPLEDLKLEGRGGASRG